MSSHFVFIVMLLWFVKKSSITSAMDGVKVAENNLLPVKDVSNSCLDENIEVKRIRAYFTSTGWSALLRLLVKVQEIGWLCTNCKKQLDGDQIGCDGCLKWRHYHCAHFTKHRSQQTGFVDCQI